MSSRIPAAVNARFLKRAVTGVERLAHELVARLPAALDVAELPMLTPPAGWSTGVRGHLWEQAALPRAFRDSRAQVLVSPCNVGPVAVRRQVVIVCDVAPFLAPSTFSRAYGLQVRAVERALARSCTLATISEHSRRDIGRVLGLDPADVHLVPPAVGPPFTETVGTGAGDYCLTVGGHDERKNVQFLLDLWPAVHARTGLQLRVVSRSSSTTVRAGQQVAPAGVTWEYDPDDERLAALYADARCVLSPSRYEGFGLPLLEGIATGTPFLATDTGAAAELAVRPDQQLLPLDAAQWQQRLVEWAAADLTRLRSDCRDHAARWTWERSAAALAAAVVATVERTTEAPVIRA